MTNFLSKILRRGKVKTTNVVGTFTNEDFPGQYPFGSSSGNALDANTIILACTLWVGRTFPEARFKVVKDQINEKELVEEVEVPDHPLTKIMARPNPHHSRSLMWQATLTSLMIDGNAYWMVLRGQDKKPTQFWWMPSDRCRPVRRAGSKNFIDFYEFTDDTGKRQELDPRLVIHLRDGIDPKDPKKGRSKIKALLLEVLTDNEAALYTKSVLENMGVTGGILAPDNPDFTIDKDEAKLMARLYQAGSTGANRGKVTVFTAAMKFLRGGMTPKEVLIDKVRDIPEERITAVFGLPAIVINLGAGLDHATMANFKEAREQAYESNIIPTQSSIAEQLDVQALPLFEETFAERRCAFDNTKVRCFQEDENKKHERVRSNWEKGMYTLGQCADILAFEVDASERNLRVFDFQTGLQVSAQAQAKMKMRGRRAIFEGLIDDAEPASS